MRRSHFRTLRPICPRCRRDRQAQTPLKLAVVVREQADDVLEGVLHCPDDACRMEYPILDGIPVLVADLRNWVANSLHQLTARDDLSPELATLIGDAAGQGSSYDSTRQHLSIYAWDHYGEFDPEEGDGDPRPGSVSRTVAACLELADHPGGGPILDLGCSVGRSTFEVAAGGDDPVVGIDLNFAMLQAARRAMSDGRVRYDRRRTGLVYDRREFPVDLPSRDRVDFWAADVLSLPFGDGTFELALALNVVDCVASPAALLAEVSRLLRSGAPAIVTTPYDWSTSATPPEAWIGGHSQRGEDGGACEARFLALVETMRSSGAAGLTVAGEIERLPWATRLHDRSVVHYSTHVLTLRRE